MWAICQESDWGKEFMAWQHPVWDDDGYFWTSLDVWRDIKKKNPSVGRLYAFDRSSDAEEFIAKLGLIESTSGGIVYPVYVKE